MPLVRSSSEETESCPGVVGEAEYLVARRRALDILGRLHALNPDEPTLWAAFMEVTHDFGGAPRIVEGLTLLRPERSWLDDLNGWFGLQEPE